MRGASLPGMPGVYMGQNNDVCWTITNVMADVQDLFVERIEGDYLNVVGLPGAVMLPTADQRLGPPTGDGLGPVTRRSRKGHGPGGPRGSARWSTPGWERLTARGRSKRL